MSNLINRILGNLATRIMFIIYISIIFITSFFLIFGYVNAMALQKQRQYDKLMAAVSSMAINIDGEEHMQLMRRYSPSDNAELIWQDTTYQKINKKLASIVADNNLNSPMYTLVYFEKEDYFCYGVRSDDYIDFKNQYSQSPEILMEKFEEGGTIPLYESENGMWLSAFYPIRSEDGKVTALLEADIEFSEFKALVNDQYMKELFISLAVIVLLALVFIPYARKVLAEDEKRRQVFILQKRTIEAKNRDIMDSIKYALKIQSAMLPSTRIFEENGLQGFVFHQAKDVVAGDFYWIEKHDDDLFFAVADCTGHGVPGAIVSILCSDALNRAVSVLGIREPGKILDEVRDIVIRRLGRGDQEMKDGMDIALCRLNLKTLEMQFSGANNPIYIHSSDNNGFSQVSSCKQPVGQYIRQSAFKTQFFQLNKGDSIFLFTDGYADQFGGPAGKKFKYKPFKELLSRNVGKEMHEQKATLRKELRTWMRDHEQIDDICVMGVKI